MRSTLIAVLLLASALPAAGQSTGDREAITATAKDYIEGWYTGDVARMQRALHPELVKRIVGRDSTGAITFIDNQGATRLVAGVARGGGTRTPVAQRRTDVTVYDVFRRTAIAKIDASDWVDYLQLVKVGDRWLILNVLWELRS